MKFFLATDEGIVRAEGQNGEWNIKGRSLPDLHVTSIIAIDGAILAGTVEGVYRSDDMGELWHPSSEGLEERHVRRLGFNPRPDGPGGGETGLITAGTEPAAIFYSEDRGKSWRECPEIAAMRDRYDWMLPYSPEDGCIRGFAFQRARGYAAAEDGAALRSDDGGRSWRLAPGSAGYRAHAPQTGEIHSDVHSVAVHPDSPDMVLAPTAGGLYFSECGGGRQGGKQAGGRTGESGAEHGGRPGGDWRNLYRCYCRAVWWDPKDRQHIIFGPADGVDSGGRIEESRDGGENWSALNEGTSAPWSGHMVERFTSIDSALFAVLSNGDLMEMSLRTPGWRTILEEAGKTNDVAALV